MTVAADIQNSLLIVGIGNNSDLCALLDEITRVRYILDRIVVFRLHDNSEVIYEFFVISDLSYIVLVL